LDWFTAEGAEDISTVYANVVSCMLQEDESLEEHPDVVDGECGDWTSAAT
jgi:hypothetical protein